MLGVIFAHLKLQISSKTKISEPVGLKLKSNGNSRPLGSRVFGWRSSSKKACEQASNGENREAGVYSSKREHRVMASGGVRGLNTWKTRHKWWICSSQQLNNGYREWQCPADLTNKYMHSGGVYLGPWMSFDLGEFEFCVVWVHLSDLLSCWGSQHLKNRLNSTNAKIQINISNAATFSPIIACYS